MEAWLIALIAGLFVYLIMYFVLKTTKYLISIKPNRVDCYLYHFATVELTKELSKILGYKHFYLNCNVADPEKEALIVKDLVEEQQKINKVDSLILLKNMDSM